MRSLPPVIERGGDLPPAQQLSPDAQERAWLEFKQTMAHGDGQDLAVHVASFANHLGGVILVGADDTGGTVSYAGIPLAYAAQLKESFESAAKEWCHPVPEIRPVIVELAGSTNVVLAVNVTAHVGGVVGVNPRLAGDKSARNQVAWMFPVRVASHTKYVPASELPMFFDTAARTVALRLSRIPPKESIALFATPFPGESLAHQNGAFIDRGPLWLAAFEAELTEVSLERNCAVFRITVGSNGHHCDHPTAVPLRDVLDVWHGGKGWRVRVRGRILPEGTTNDACQPVMG